jgi:transcriptional regulator with XRE-family HTH domain
MTSDARPLRIVLRDARLTLGKSQRALGAEHGVAGRTVMRWEQGRSRPSRTKLGNLMARVQPDDPHLAQELQASFAELEIALGLATSNTVQPVAMPTLAPTAILGATPTLGVPAGPGPRASTMLTPRLAVESVVYAVAEALDASPRTARTAVLAAFTRASSLALGVDVVLEALRLAAPAEPEI